MFRIHSRCGFSIRSHLPPSQSRVAQWYHRPRLFHASPYRQSENLELLTSVASRLGNTVQSVPYCLLEAVHSTTGLSWGFTIPTVAILVRALIIHPFITLPRRRASQKRIDLRPLEQAYSHAIRRKLEAENTHREEKYQQLIKRGVNVDTIEDKPRTRKELGKAIMKSEIDYKVRLYKTFGCENWRTNVWAWQLGVFWAMEEAMRSMAASKSPLQGICYDVWSRQRRWISTTSSQWNGPSHSDEASQRDDILDSPQTMSIIGPADTLAEGTPNGTNGEVASETLPEGPVPAQLLAHPHQDIDSGIPISPFFTPSLTDEGFLWFQNLAAPDPLSRLPLVVASLIVSHVLLVRRRDETRDWEILGKEQRSSRLRTVCYAVVIGPVLFITAAHMPTGFLLYWASSTGCAMLQALYVEWKYPWRKVPTACKRIVKERA